MSTKPIDQGEGLSRRLRLQYMLALLLVALLISTASFAVRFVESKQSHTAALVNVSGKQRYRALEALVLLEQLGSNISERQKRRNARELDSLLGLIADQHAALLSGDKQLGLPSTQSPAVQSLFFEAPHLIDARLNAFLLAARRMLQSFNEGRLDASAVDMHYLRGTTRKTIIPALAALTENYQQEGEAAVKRSLMISGAVWMTALVLIVLEALFIFDPIVRRVRDTVAALGGKVEALVQAEAKLLALQSQHEAMVANLPGMVYRSRQSTSGEVNLEYVSEGIETLYGVAADQAFGSVKVIRDTIHPDDRADYIATVERSAATLSDLQSEYRIVARDGNERWARASAKVHMDGRGGVVWDGIVLDITDIKHAEFALRHSEARLAEHVAKLEASQADLETQAKSMRELAERYAEERERAQASERSKAEFLASMSHEIRTPMAGVMGLADILLDSELTSEQCDQVQKIKRASQSLLTIINDILDLSKLEADKLDIESRDFNLMDVVSDVQDLLYRNAERKGLYLALELDQALPESVNGDSARLRQVLINLLGNAVKFTEQGGVTLTAKKKSDGDDGERLHFTVADTGIGIPVDAHAKLFDEFTQADASISRRYEGTGLGLAICKRLVKLMGGQIGIDSKVGEGSSFWFWVPYRAAAVPVARDRQPQSDEGFQASRSLEILVAEDNQLNQQIIMTLLRRYGHRLTLVENGAEAVEAATDAAFDLILMDIRMPQMSGTAAAEAIRGLGSEAAEVPIIALTADAIVEHQRSYLAAGMQACVAKPIDLAELLMAIDTAVGEKIHHSVPDQSSPSSGKGSTEPATPAKGGSDGLDEDSVHALLDRLNRLADGSG